MSASFDDAVTSYTEMTSMILQRQPGLRPKIEAMTNQLLGELEQISEVADDTTRWSQAESRDIYASLAGDCAGRANTIRREMEN